MGARRRGQFLFLIVLTTIGAVAEVISLGAVLPFISVLTVPERALTYPLVADLASFFGIKSPSELALPMTMGFVGIALVSGIFRVFLLWVNTKFAFSLGADLSLEVYRKTLYQSYDVHVSRNSSDVISGIVNKVNGIVNWVILPMLTLISSGTLMLALTGTLLFIDPLVATLSILTFGSSYGVITWFSRRRIRLNGDRVNQEQTRVIKALQEGLGGIRDVLLDGTQPIYCDIYSRADRPLRKAYGNNVFIGGSPRFAMESLGITLIALLAYFLSRNAYGFEAMLPVLGALALGAQRILPALQQSYSSWASIIGSTASLSDIVLLLDEEQKIKLSDASTIPLSFRKEIRFKNVSFSYEVSSKPILKDLNFVIKKGDRVGIIGITGSGKSTILDLLMGLLTPQVGELTVDDQVCRGHILSSWQRNIAHVPQTIYLADASIAENIAFGVPAEKIDMDRVRRAAEQARIATFIEGQPLGYSSRVGERGVRLSGGQQQRIGIARALYKNVTVLILDEATSALDSATEDSVMDAINALDPNLTIIIVTHRISTLRRCGVVYSISQGGLRTVDYGDEVS